MTKTFTNDDLVRLLYEEVNEDERLELKESLSADMDLRANMEELNEAKALLEGFSLKVPNEVVNRILYASKNLQSV